MGDEEDEEVGEIGEVDNENKQQPSPYGVYITVDLPPDPPVTPTNSTTSSSISSTNAGDGGNNVEEDEVYDKVDEEITRSKQYQDFQNWDGRDAAQAPYGVYVTVGRFEPINSNGGDSPLTSPRVEDAQQRTNLPASFLLGSPAESSVMSNSNNNDNNNNNNNNNNAPLASQPIFSPKGGNAPLLPIKDKDNCPVAIPRSEWVPDAVRSVCTCSCNCQRKFSLIVRRHHCRLCGEVVCAECSMHRLTAKIPPSSSEKINNSGSGSALDTVAANGGSSSSGSSVEEYHIVRVCDGCVQTLQHGGKIVIASKFGRDAGESLTSNINNNTSENVDSATANIDKRLVSLTLRTDSTRNAFPNNQPRNASISSDSSFTVNEIEHKDETEDANPCKAVPDWNEEYQSLCENLDILQHQTLNVNEKEREENLVSTVRKLRSLVVAFSQEACRIVQTLVHEKSLPNKSKSIKSVDVGKMEER